MFELLYDSKIWASDFAQRNGMLPVGIIFNCIYYSIYAILVVVCAPYYIIKWW